MSNNLKNTINLVLGDWSHDGHGRSQIVAIKSNLTIKQIEQAYQDGVDEIGIDVTADIAFEYEESYLLDEDKDVLIKSGFDATHFQFTESRDGKTFLEVDDFVEIWAFIVKSGDPGFEFEYIDNDIKIGGYGLFQ